jgi:hypothetical protein
MKKNQGLKDINWLIQGPTTIKFQSQGLNTSLVPSHSPLCKVATERKLRNKIPNAPEIFRKLSSKNS